MNSAEYLGDGCPVPCPLSPFTASCRNGTPCVNGNGADSDSFVDNRLLEAADRKWLEHGGGSAIGRVRKVDALLERANPSAPLEERCAAMGVSPETSDAAALAAEALGEEDYENLA